MIGHELREFVDRVLDQRMVDEEDVKMLQRDVIVDAASAGM